MDLHNLSSNWKKLQATLNKDGAQQHTPRRSSASSKPNGTVKENPSQNPRKRKASERSRSTKEEERPRANVKRKQLAHAAPRTAQRRTQHAASRHGMGAYVSSLPTASYAFLDRSKTSPATRTASAAPPADHSQSQTPAEAGKYISLDCEMVVTRSATELSVPATSKIPSSTPEYFVLARCTLVGYTGAVVYDEYVRAPDGVVISDYRTRWSGITAAHLAPDNTATRPKAFEAVQREVAELLRGRVLVGHSVRNDLAVLGLTHPHRDVRDTARYVPFRELAMAGMPGSGAGAEGKGAKKVKLKSPSLKRLAKIVLGREIQLHDGEDGGRERGTKAPRGHDSVEDARAAMELYRKEKDGFEKEIVKRFGFKRGAPARTTANGHFAASNGNQNRDADDEEDLEDEDGNPSAKKTPRKKKRKNGKKKGKYH